MAWKTIFPYSMLAIFFHSFSIPYQKSSIPYSNFLPYSIPYVHTKVCLDWNQRVICIVHFATLSVPLQVGLVARVAKQHGTMHLIPNLKHHHNDLPQKFNQHEQARSQDLEKGGAF